MADSVQPLSEFLQNLVEDIQAGAISPQEALAASIQYPYLREALVNNYGQLAAAATTGDEALKSTLQNVFTQLINRLNNLPSFQNQSPDDPLSEEDVRTVGALRETAINNVKTDGATKLAPLANKRREFIHELVGKFSSTIPTGGPNEEAIGQAVDRSLAAAAQEATSAQTKERFSELLVAAATVTSISPLTNDASKELSKVIASSFEANSEYVTEVRKVVQSQKETLTTLFSHPETTRPDVLVDILIHAPPTEQKTDVVVRALKLADVAGSLDAHKGPLPPSKNFFHAGNARGVAKGAQQAADGILSLLGEPLREIILKEKINGTLRNMFANTQGMIDRLGENFVRSSVFSQILQNLTKSLNDKPTTSQARGIFDDVFSSVFKGPLNNFTTGGTKEQLLNFFELARANANAPINQKFLPNGATPWNFLLANKQRSSSQRGFGGFFGWLPSLGFGGLGGWVSNMFTAGFDRSTSFIFSGSRIPNQLSSSRRAIAIRTPFLQDMPLLIAIVVMVTIVLLFVVQSPLNSSLLNHSAKVSALLASLQNFVDQVNVGVAEVTSFQCSWSGATPPPATINTCPVHATISQLPFNPTGSHKTLNAYDFAAGTGTPILAAHDAYVVSYTNSYAPNQFALASYGNNVVLIGTNPSSNKTFCTNYAHMLDVAPIVLSSKGTPTLIKAGTVIGYVDTTGYTYGNGGPGTGTHLHFGYKGENENVPFSLPAGCP
jgi:hypothetical protein